MRISIWQQFSSNHSSYFTVVGEFESPAAAQEAAAKLQEFFDAINEWFDRPENAADGGALCADVRGAWV